MGHTDTLTIGDAGLPIPNAVKRIDLAVKAGLPAFTDVLETVLTGLCIEKVVLAEEIKEKNPEMYTKIMQILKNYTDETGWKLTMIFVSHEEFKKKTASSKAVVRTGEITPFANIILESGVVF